MAIISDAEGNDFIHVAGDGRIAPEGYTDLALATNLRDTINLTHDDDIVRASGGDDIINVTNYTGRLGGSGHIGGGSGDDTLNLTYMETYDFRHVRSIENVFCRSFANLSLTFYDGNVAAGGVLTLAIDGGDQTARSFIDASRVTNYALHITTTALPPTYWTATLDDHITLGAGDDVVSTNDGNDTIRGGLGNDIINGGIGFDTAVFSGNYADYTVTTDNVHSTVIVSGPDGTDTLTSINALQFDDQTVQVDPPDLTLTGDERGNHFVGGDGDDTLSGFGGADYLEGMDGDDHLVGGSGRDIILGGGGNDVLIGGKGRDFLVDNAGINSFNAGDGKDTISIGGDAAGQFTFVKAGGGNDLINLDNQVNGSRGAGHIDGGSGDDTLELSHTEAYDFRHVRSIETVVVDTYANPSLTFYNGNVAAGGVLTVAMDGGANAGVSFIDASRVTNYALHIVTTDMSGAYWGDALDDHITLGAGDDVVSTNYGNDTIRGGLGNDTINGGTGFDTAVFSGNYADYTVTQDNVHSTVIVSGPDGTDTLTSIDALQFDDQTVQISDADAMVSRSGYPMLAVEPDGSTNYGSHGGLMHALIGDLSGMS